MGTTSLLGCMGLSCLGTAACGRPRVFSLLEGDTSPSGDAVCSCYSVVQTRSGQFEPFPARSLQRHLRHRTHTASLQHAGRGEDVSPLCSPALHSPLPLRL